MYPDFSFIHAMSDVTGFGLAGHVREMLQNSALSALIEIIPSIKHSRELSSELGYAFEECLSHETAGGMIMSVDPKMAEEFSERLTKRGIKNWTVGIIDKKKPGTVRVSDNVEVLEITNF